MNIDNLLHTFLERRINQLPRKTKEGIRYVTFAKYYLVEEAKIRK